MILNRWHALQEMVLHDGVAAPTAPKAPRSVGEWLLTADPAMLTDELRAMQCAMRAQHREDVP